jgi:hypothetical protein
VQSPTQSWQNLAQLLCSESAEDAVRCRFPEVDRRASLLEALRDAQIAANVGQLEQGKKLHAELQGLSEQLRVFSQISRCPIVGITGLLNSGKSSLLATYLSPTGRARVLRGLSNAAGTNRFVLWLPLRWRDQEELMGPLHSFLAQLFGHPAEPLSSDPDQAFSQYNGHIVAGSRNSDVENFDPMSIPLIAHDEALNELKVGFLDCPDIQAGFANSRHGPEADASQRRRWLAAIGRLCSAFVVMTKLSSLQDQSVLNILTTLRDRMPGVRRILTVNRVKSRYSPSVVWEQTRSIVEQFGISSVYMAYDFRIAAADTFIPAPPPGMLTPTDRAKLPIFFEISSSGPVHTSNPALSSVKQPSGPSYLFHLGQQLDAGVLAEQSRKGLVQQLKLNSSLAADWHLRNPELRQQQLVEAWSVVASACYSFMVEQDQTGKTNLRLQASPAIINQMTESLQRTAPAWMKLSLKIDRSSRKFQKWVSDKTEQLKVLQGVSQAVSNFAKRFRSGEVSQIVTPEQVCKTLRANDIHDVFASFAEVDLLANIQSGIARFASEDRSYLDERALDAWAETVWNNMSMASKLKRSVQPLALLTGPVIAAILLPIDWGGTSVLVFASTKELLAAVGAAALLPSMVGGGESEKIVQQETPWRQLSDLFAILCDTLGLPRPSPTQLPSCGESPRQLTPSNVPCIPATATTFSLWLPAPGSVERLQSLAQRAE